MDEKLSWPSWPTDRRQFINSDHLPSGVNLGSKVGQAYKASAGTKWEKSTHCQGQRRAAELLFLLVLSKTKLVVELQHNSWEEKIVWAYPQHKFWGRVFPVPHDLHPCTCQPNIGQSQVVTRQFTVKPTRRLVNSSKSLPKIITINVICGKFHY